MNHVGRDGQLARVARQLEQLRDMIKRHAAVGSVTAIDGVRVASIDSDAIHTSPSGTVFALIVQGVKVLGIGNRMYEYGAGQYLVSSVDLPVTGSFLHASASEPSLGFGLDLRSPTISALLLESDPKSPIRPAGAPATATLGIADAQPELLDAVIRMLTLLDAPDGDRAILAPMLEREIVWRLLQGPLGPSVRQLGIIDSSMTHVGTAVRWITDHYEQPFRVEELARSCGVSASAFHRSFRAITGLSPIQFQKQMRLQKSRLLLVGGIDVATVGHQVGYDSISQFSREYRRQFGLPPSQDAALLRDGNLGASAPACSLSPAARPAGHPGQRLDVLTADSILPSKLDTAVPRSST